MNYICFVSLFVCQLVGGVVNRITQKVQSGFPGNLDAGWVPAQNRPH